MAATDDNDCVDCEDETGDYRVTSLQSHQQPPDGRDTPRRGNGIVLSIRGSLEAGGAHARFGNTIFA